MGSLAVVSLDPAVQEGTTGSGNDAIGTQDLPIVIAELAIQTSVHEVPNADVISNLNILDVRSNFSDNSCHFMTGNNWVRSRSPVIISKMGVRMAKAAILDVNLEVILTSTASFDLKFLKFRATTLLANCWGRVHVGC
jgi:hypothetical protein